MFEDGETVLAHLLVIFHPFDEAESTAVEQLNKVSDLITDVAGREIPRLVEHAALNRPQEETRTDEDDDTNGTGGDKWEDDPVDRADPFASPSPSPSPSPATTGSSSEPSAEDDWLSDPDDPLA